MAETATYASADTAASDPLTSVASSAYPVLSGSTVSSDPITAATDCQRMIQAALQTQASEPAGRHLWAQIRAQLAESRPYCWQNAHYLALLGAAQLHTGQIAQARDTLERALLLNPRQGRARIDYAQVLFLQGQPFAALQLNQQLLDSPDLPAQARPLLKTRHQRWQQRLKKQDIRLNLGLGFDNNLNSAASLTRLELTPGSGSVIQLPLSDPSQPIDALVLNAGLTARWQQLTPKGVNHWQLNLHSQHSRYPYDQQQISLSYGQRIQHPSLQQIASARMAQSAQSQWQAGLLFARYNRQTLYQGAELHLSTRQPLNTHCDLTLPLTLTGQYFPAYSRQHALQAELQPGLSCRLSSTLRLNTGLDLAYNHALADRSGGRRHQLGGRLQLQWHEAPRLWSLAYSQKTTRDQSGYSPLLKDNAPRYIRRQQLVAGLIQPLTPSVSLSLRLQHQENQSNLALFQYSRTQAQLGITLLLP